MTDIYAPDPHNLSVANDHIDAALNTLHPYIKEVMQMSDRSESDPYGFILTYAFGLSEVSRALPDVEACEGFRPGLTATPNLDSIVESGEWPDCEFAQLLISTEGWVGNLPVTPADIQKAVDACDALLDEFRENGLGND